MYINCPLYKGHLPFNGYYSDPKVPKIEVPLYNKIVQVQKPVRNPYMNDTYHSTGLIHGHRNDRSANEIFMKGVVN